MEYFEDGTWSAAGDGCCSDDNCPCPEVAIPRGAGYLYISPEIVDLRRQFRTDKAALADMQRRIKSSYGSPVSWVGRIGPVLLCEEGARLRGLDLEIAAADAQYWWETARVPLRATPLAAIQEAELGPGKDKITLRYGHLLGIIVWIQAPGEVCSEAHPAAMKFFETHNPQAVDFMKRHESKNIQVGVEKMDKPNHEFVRCALEAAMDQAKSLDPCVLVVQQGSIRADGSSIGRAYLIGSFFQGPKTSLIMPQPSTQIILV